MTKQVVIGGNELVPPDKLAGHEFIFRKYYKPLMVYATKLTRSREDAEDIVQNVFLELWKKDIEQIGDKLTGYLFVAVKNGFLKRERHLKVVRKYEGSLGDLTAVNDNPHHYMMLREIEECLEETLQAVPDRTREIFMLSRYERKKHREIASKLQISIKTVEAHLTKVLSLLKGKLSHHLMMALAFIFSNFNDWS